MKIAGLTWWRNNYGSVLQAYALQEVLTTDYGVDYEILCQFERRAASVGNLLQNLKRHGVKKTADKLIWKFGIPQLRQRNANIQSFIDQNLKVSQRHFAAEEMEEANSLYDGFVCGSDQVWNPVLPGADERYRLRFAAEDKLKFAYAPSVGVAEMDPAKAEEYRSDLARLKGISCREQQGTDLINRIMGSDICTTVLDPTMLLDRSRWDELSCKPIVEGDYIFAYMLRGTKEQRKQIEKFARQKKLKLVTIPFLDTERIELYDFRMGDVKVWSAGVEDFVSLIRHAKYVFTDSFHCISFSCMYHRPFFAFPKIGAAQNTRLYELQKQLHIPDRVITESNPINSMPETIDWTPVDNEILNMKIVSRNYLDRILNRE